MKAIVVAATLAAALSVSASFAVPVMTAGDLYGFCVSTNGDVQNVCSKYILGAVQGIGLAAGKLNDGTTFCIPDDISETRLVDIFIRAARADFAAFPQDQKMPAISLVGAVAMRAFPCR